MDKNITPPPAVTASNVLDIVSDLHADAVRHQQLLESVMAFLQQFNPPVVTPALPAWHPGETGGVSDLSPPSSKVRWIEGRQQKSMDIVARLKATAIGRFYASHLKQHPFVRGVVIWLWRNTYPIYANHISIILKNRKTKRWQSLIKLGDYTKSRGLRTIQLVNAVVVETPTPKVFPESDQGYLKSPHVRYYAPPIYVAIINDGMIYGGTNLVLTDDGVICHDLYDFERDYTSEELHGRTLIDPKSKQIRWLLHNEAPERIPVAASFVDACAANYAHWLTEVLPRIALFCAEERFHGVPIVVDDGLHKNIMESLFAVVGTEREIVLLQLGYAIQVETLYVTSVAGYVPFEPRKKKQISNHHGIFNANAFIAVRTALNKYVNNRESDSYPRRIYIRRNSGSRNIINQHEIEKLLHSHGYSIVESEKLSFLEQVALFANAKTIIGPVGAALANSLFIKKSTRVGIMVAQHKDMLYGYWPSMMSPQGADVSYIIGEIKGSAEHGVHGDFYIPITALNDFIENLKNDHPGS